MQQIYHQRRRRDDLARLEAICGDGCPPARSLASVITTAQASGVQASVTPAAAHVVSADTPGSGVVNN